MYYNMTVCLQFFNRSSSFTYITEITSDLLNQTKKTQLSGLLDYK